MASFLPVRSFCLSEPSGLQEKEAQSFIKTELPLILFDATKNVFSLCSLLSLRLGFEIYPQPQHLA